MSTLKPGDKIICIDADEPLEYGKIYTFKEYPSVPSHVTLEENLYTWFSSRFILATPLLEALS
jgi:hypothetical protein